MEWMKFVVFLLDDIDMFILEVYLLLIWNVFYDNFICFIIRRSCLVFLGCWYLLVFSFYNIEF